MEKLEEGSSETFLRLIPMSLHNVLNTLHKYQV
jgi:hypothetical protein